MNKKHNSIKDLKILTEIMISKDGAVCAHLIEHGYHLLALCKGAHCVCVWIRKDNIKYTDG